MFDDHVQLYFHLEGFILNLPFYYGIIKQFIRSDFVNVKRKILVALK